MAALAVMAKSEATNKSAKVRDLIREAWARLPANQPHLGAVPAVPMEET